MKKIFCLFGIAAVLMMSTANVQAQQWNNNNGAKGAAIGAGIGAIAGALVNKYNPAAGAVVGSLIGAGIGYVAANNQNNAGYGQQVVYQESYGNQYQYNDRGCDRRDNRYYGQNRRRDNDRRDRRYNNGYNRY
jgi:hypothetical protein